MGFKMPRISAPTPKQIIGGAVGGVPGAVIGSIGGTPGNIIDNTIKDPGKAAKNYLVNVGGAMSWGLAGDPLRSLFGLNDPSAPGMPGASPTLDQVKEAQRQQAMDFEKNIPKYSESLFGNLQQTERQNLARNLTGIKNDMNSRGLLYSKMNLGKQLGAQAESASNLAKGKSDINTALQDQAAKLKANAISTGLGQIQTQQSIQDQVYNQALSNMMARRQMFGDVAGAAGMAGGMYMAGRK